MNIAAAVALSGLGLDQTELLIVADPTIDTHVIELEAAGTFGSFTFKEDVAISGHRKTGQIVAMAESFPLEWGRNVRGLFTALDATSSVRVD